MSFTPESKPVSSPYSALAAQGATAHEKAEGAETLASLLHNSAPRCLIDEALKLEDLKGALWAAFKSAPENGIPSPLIDLTTAYTSALRLQLSLIGYAPAKTNLSAPARVTGRAPVQPNQSKL